METFNLVSLVVRALAKEEVRIISGGVPGVDLAAHLAAADDPASATFVVLANPPELGLCGHEWSSTILENQILRRGAFLSEYSEQRDLETIEFRERLLARDRIISGLCDLFLVFECREDSATVDTARRAIAQGKEVLCIQSAQESVRRGIGQLAHEFLIPIFDERTDSHATIVNGILARIMKVAESLV